MKKDWNNERNGKPGNNTSQASHSSHAPDRLLPPRGDYQTLLSFQKAELVKAFISASEYRSRFGQP